MSNLVENDMISKKWIDSLYEDEALGRIGDAVMESTHENTFIFDEQLFKSLVDHLFDGIISIDKTGTVKSMPKRSRFVALCWTVMTVSRFPVLY